MYQTKLIQQKRELVDTDRTVIEKIIESFVNVGINNFQISINFKGKILKAFFEELDPPYSIKFIEEKTPLGTAGSLYKLSAEMQTTFIVTNCDVIIEVDHQDLINFHKENKYDLTLVASAKEIVIPYGACELNEEGNLERILEKPKLDYLINTGLYIIEPSALDLIPKNKFFDMTDLIDSLKKRKRKVQAKKHPQFLESLKFRLRIFIQIQINQEKNLIAHPWKN